MEKLITTLGPLSITELGMILPHEHIFVDLRTWDTPGYAEAEREDVLRLMVPEVEQAKQAGVTAIVECSPVGVGRRADLDRAVSEATQMPIVVPTGVYREPWIPAWFHETSENEIADWMLSELTGEIETSGVQAAWIKLSAGDDGLTPCEIKVLRAAAAAARETNAVIGSHTIRGRVVRQQLEIIEELGHSPERFIWIHTQMEPDFSLHLEIGRRGAWLEYDAIGSETPDSDALHLQLIQQALDADLGQKLLLSQDRGWYDPALPGGGIPKPYTYLPDKFLPQLLAVGVDDATIHRLMHSNPFRAYAR